MGITAGINTAQVAVIEEYGVHNVTEAHGVYSSNMSFHLGVDLNKSLTKNLELSLQMLFKQYSFDYVLKEAFDFSTISYTEKQNKFEFPLSLSYKFNIKKVSPYIRVGFNTGLQIKSEIEANRVYTDNSHNDLESPLIDISDKRNTLSYMAVFGVGIRYRIDRGYIVLDVRYNKGLSNITNENERYAENELIYKYYLLDDDMYLNSLSFSLGYSYSIFKPKKKAVK
jgi:hypothetical protein